MDPIAPTGPPALALQGIKKHFGGIHALTGVDLQLFPGQVMGLLGENGAGKSTAVKIMTGIYHPDGGQLLVAADPLAPADVIVISVDGGAAEVLEAADLVKGGFAPRVAVLAGPQDPVALEFARRGLAYADRNQVSLQTLHALGVAQAEMVEPRVDGSNQESDLVPSWCQRHGFRRAILVVTPDHSSRVRRLLARTAAGRPVALQVRYSRYSSFRADNWWQSREGLRMELVGLQKLLVDVLNHP